MLPPVLRGSRWTMFQRLILSGLAQAAIALGCSWLLAGVLTGTLGTDAVLPVAGLVVAAVATVALRRFEHAEAERLGQHYVLDVRLRLFQATVEDGGRRQRHGIAMTRMITDLTSLKNWVSLGLARVVVAGLAALGGVAALWVASPALAPWATGLVVAILGSAALLAIPLRRRIRDARRYRGRLAARIGELTRASETLLQTGTVASESKRLRRLSRRMADHLAGRMGYVGLLIALPEMLVPLAAAVFVVAAVLDPTLSAQQPAVVLLILAFMAQPLRDIVGAIDYRLSYLESRRRLDPLLATLAARSPAPVVAEIAPGASPRLALDVASAAVAGVTGTSALVATSAGGVGPSSVAAPALRLVTADTDLDDGGPADAAVVVRGRVSALRFVDLDEAAVLLRAICGLGPEPDGWHVTIAGEPIGGLPVADRRARVQLVSPRLPLLRRSIQRNMRDFVPGAKSARIAEVFAEVGLADDPELRRLGKRKLDELGRGLSTSLDARLRLARAVLADPAVILSDDRSFVLDIRARAALERVVASRGIPALVAVQAGVDVPGTWHVVTPATIVPPVQPLTPAVNPLEQVRGGA